MKKKGQTWAQIWETYDKKFPKNPPKDQLPDDLDDLVPVKREREDNTTYILNQLEERVYEKSPIVLKKRKKPPEKKQPERSTVIFEPVTNNYVREENNELDISPFDTLTEDMKTEEDVDFLEKMEQLNRANKKFGNILPDQEEVLRFIENLQVEKQPVWFHKVHDDLADTGRKYPQMPVLSRVWLKNFMRAPKQGERECSHPNCKSMEMGGFRCRELLLPSDTGDSLEQKWCYICHLNETNRLYWQCLNTEWQDIDISKPFTIHYFIVATDRVGEYRLSKTIQGDSLVRGIYGPFPIFNVNNYIKDEVENGVWGWRESDSLVFRPAQKASVPTKFCQSTKQQNTNH